MTSLALVATSAAAAALAPVTASAQDWPVEPVRLIAPFPPGSSSDIIGRLVAQWIGDMPGQPVVVENKGGAGGHVGVDAVAKAHKDG